jgi:multicomponent Na+:H+ antiporter subunit B
MSVWIEDWTSATDYLAIDWVAMTLLILSAFMAIRMRDLLASAVILGIFSLLMALIYLLLDAPDVALTEAAVGAGISTVMFLGALSFTDRKHKIPPLKLRIAPLMVVTLVGAALITATDELPPFGAADAPVHTHVAPYYIEHMREDIDIPNLVTAILGSYRGFDTLGEVGVIFLAGISITALLMNLPQIRPTAAEAPMQAPAAPTAAKKTVSRRKKPATRKKKGSAS